MPDHHDQPQPAPTTTTPTGTISANIHKDPAADAEPTTPTQSDRRHNDQPPRPPLDFIIPDVTEVGQLFTQPGDDYQLCAPHLMPLRSQTLEKLERMQRDAQQQLKETRARTAAATAETEAAQQQQQSPESAEFN